LTDLLNTGNIKCHENPCSESQGVPCGWTDRHEANSHFFAIL